MRILSLQFSHLRADHTEKEAVIKKEAVILVMEAVILVIEAVIINVLQGMQLHHMWCT